jgi:hypothetical protein
MGVSLKPSEFIEGGAVPVDRNLTWKECRFDIFDYTKKDGTVVARSTTARMTYVDDDGAEFIQHYSVAQPERFVPSQDGKQLVAVGGAQALSKSSNYYILMNALINAGFPENKLGEDISILDGLYTYNIGLPEPKRSGLVREAVEGAREKVLSVPSQILKLPWEKKGGKGTPAKATKPVVVEESGDDEAVVAKAIALVEKSLVDGETTRQKLAVSVFKTLAKDPDKDAVAALIFKAEFQGALLANGYTVDGEKISKA